MGYCTVAPSAAPLAVSPIDVIVLLTSSVLPAKNKIKPMMIPISTMKAISLIYAEDVPASRAPKKPLAAAPAALNPLIAFDTNMIYAGNG